MFIFCFLVWDVVGEDGIRWYKTSEFGKVVICVFYKFMFIWNIEIFLFIIKYVKKGYVELL